jgi:protein-export membrane protein SecF
MNFGLDFKPGATATINFSNYDEFENVTELDLIKDDNKKITPDSIKTFLQDYLSVDETLLPSNKEISIVQGYDKVEEANTLTIKIEFTKVGTNDTDTSFLTSFDEQVTNQLNLSSVIGYEEYVSISQQVSSPTMAKATVINALLSLMVAFILIVIYISIRFRFTYALASLIALVFDVLSILAIFAIFRIEVQVEFVSAILAIIGYSINDTVVIFDRVREIAKETNFGNIDEQGRKDIVNKALQNCTNRSLWTSISTILPVLALIFIGSSGTLPFSIAMLVGLLSGCLSSLFIAPQMWLIFEKRHMRRLKEKAIKAAEHDKEKKEKNNGPEELVVVGVND